MAKTVIWIDDSEEKIENVAEGMISELWNLRINSRVVFLGDAEGISKSFSEDDFSLFIRDLFNRYEEDMRVETPDNAQEEHLKEIKDFVGQKVIPLVKNITSSPEIEELIKAWKNLNKDSPSCRNWNIKTNDLEDSLNVQCVIDQIGNVNNSVCMLDVVLLKDDEGKLNTESEECVPVLSMELYHHITDKCNAKCILYSKYTYLHRLQENWKKLYKSRYGKDVTIFPRDGLNSGAINSDIRNALKEATS